ncbi:ExbD/TolR family protein [Shewanella baltica]|uniref:ExbD/TolR family protein n=1 Tax=Shewanella baltica TaxID=62322 RepID=UPI00217D4BC7|nr:biopolymer transporter ExbD [Shewanella baltica]MCS6239719.1 biopolymer transporter ExbD [Shewanella baltica]
MQAPFSQRPRLTAHPSKRKAVISLTPLIDVVFILLVFFMLSSSFLDWRTVALDTSTAGSPAPAEQAPFLVQISADQLQLNGETITLEALQQKAQGRQPASQIVSLQPQADTPVQRLVQVLDALNAAGITPLTLVEDSNWQPVPATKADGNNMENSH